MRFISKFGILWITLAILSGLKLQPIIISTDPNTRVANLLLN